MDYTVSSRVLERIILFYILSSLYIDKYYKYISNLFKRGLLYIYILYNDGSVPSTRDPNNILERDSLSEYRCICKALRGYVTGLFKGKGFGIHKVLRKWLREGIRESSGSRTDKE